MDQNVKNHLEMSEDEVGLARQLQQYIQSDDIKNARTFIENLSPETRHRITRSNNDPLLQPALFVAIENGSTEFVKFLTNECKANVFEMGYGKVLVYLDDRSSMQFPDKWISSLEFAIYINKPDIVEYLVSIGADVESLAKDKNVMYAACVTGSLKAIQLLVDHGADVNALSVHGKTLLMEFMQDFDICRLLLDKGADINLINKYGETALHMAARWNCLAAVKFLIERKADAMIKNGDGCDLLQVASWYGSEETVDFLNETIFKNVNRHIEAFQLLGVRFVTFDTFPNFAKAVSVWRKAIQLSSESEIETHATTVCTPLGIGVEATTFGELDGMGQDSDQFYTQCIVMIYKHFGPEHPMFYRLIDSITRIYLRIGSYDRWLQFAIYWFKMTHRVKFDLKRLVSDRCDVYSRVGYDVLQICHMVVEPRLDFGLVYEFMWNVVKEAAECTQIPHMENLMDMIINATLVFAYVNHDRNEVVNFRKLVRFAVKTGLKYSKGRTLLMRAHKLYKHIPVKQSSAHLGVVTMLLECGADVNERDDEGNNVLHLLMRSYNKHRHPIERAKTLAITFVNNGVHLDARNRHGQTATSFLQHLGINVTPPINLMCSAARAIRRMNIAVQGILPKILADFVEIH